MKTEDILSRVNRFLIHETNFLKIKDNLSEDQLRLFVTQAIDDLCHEEKIPITFDQKAAIVRNLVSALISLGPIRSLMEDPDVTEIMINGAYDIYIQKAGCISKTDITFDSDEHLYHTIQKILAAAETNKRVDESSPYVDFSLSDGSRVNVIIPPCSLKGPVMTIRKFKDDIRLVEDLVRFGTLDQNIADFLSSAIQAKLNIVFCGATGSGKTTALNVFSSFIPEHERIITIEDTPELLLDQEHVVRLLTKPPNIEGKGAISMRDLFVNSLRMRPDRIIIGEIRGNEMLDLIESIGSGHSGSLAVVHAETPEDCYNRMVSMILMTGIRLGVAEINKQVARAIDIIVHLELMSDGRRRVAYVTDFEYQFDQQQPLFNHMFQFEDLGLDDRGQIKGQWTISKSSPTFLKKYHKRHIDIPAGLFSDQE